MLSQFSKSEPGQATLSDLLPFPKDVYPIGRLDKDSEGLLLLSNDASLNQKYLNPVQKIGKTYWVQVEGIPTQETLSKLKEGVFISIDAKKFKTQAAKVKSFIKAPQVHPRLPPIRIRKNIPDSWIEITIYEGKNRQIRRMMAAVGYPVLRLIRIAIGEIYLDDLKPGEVHEIF